MVQPQMNHEPKTQYANERVGPVNRRTEFTTEPSAVAPDPGLQLTLASGLPRFLETACKSFILLQATVSFCYLLVVAEQSYPA
jgi:hypothetical protein